MQKKFEKKINDPNKSPNGQKHCNRSVFIVIKFSTLPALVVVQMTISSVAHDGNVAKMTFTFSELYLFSNDNIALVTQLFNSVPAWKGSKRLLGRVLNDQCDGFDKSRTVRGNRECIYLPYSQYFTNRSTTNWFIFCYWPFTDDTGSIKCNMSKV